MKLPPYLIIAFALATLLLAPTQAQVPSMSQFAKDTETQRLQDHQRQIQQRQQRQIQQLQEEQHRTKVAADRAATEAAVAAPARRFTPTATDKFYLNRQIERIQANPRLSPAAKARLVNQILNAVQP